MFKKKSNQPATGTPWRTKVTETRETRVDYFLEQKVTRVNSKQFLLWRKCKLGMAISKRWADHRRRSLLVKTRADTLWDFSRAINPSNIQDSRVCRVITYILASAIGFSSCIFKNAIENATAMPLVVIIAAAATLQQRCIAKMYTWYTRIRTFEVDAKPCSSPYFSYY